MQGLAVGNPSGIAVEAGIARHLRLFEHPGTEVCPLTFILQTEIHLLVIARTERTIGGDGGVAGSSEWWWCATIRCIVCCIAHPLTKGLEHRDVEHRPFPCAFALVERRENPREGIHAGSSIGNRDADF